MAKTHIFLLITLSILVLSQCKHKPDEVIVENQPVIELQQGTGYVFENVTLPTNSVFRVLVKVESHPVSKEKIRNLKVYRISNNDTVLSTDTILDTEDNTIELSYASQNTEIIEDWKFVIYDASGQSASAGFSITTKKYLPEIEVIFEKDYAPISSNILIAIHAKSNTTTSKSLTNLVIKRKFNGFTMIELDTSFACYELSLFKNFLAQADEGLEEWVITVTDAANEKGVALNEVYTVVLMTDEHYGTIWNKMSPNNYAWDLVNNAAKTISDPDTQKDMANLSDSASTIGPEFFLNEWSAQNTTLFKRANQLDYDNISLLEAIDAYTGGSVSVIPNPHATGLAMGDIYVAKLRDSETYVVIQIINVITTSTDHSDRIEFRYKK